MTDDRRRAAGDAPPSAEPEPGDTLPFAATVAPPRAQGARPQQHAAGSAVPEGSRPPPAAGSAVPEGSRPPPELPYAATVTPQLAGPTLDQLPLPSRRGGSQRGGSQRGPRSADPSLDRTLDLPEGERAAEALSLEPGQQIGHFVIRKRLGEGGMGVVLAGHDADLGRPVAIKLVKAEVDRPAYRARLLREAQAMARLEHRNVVRVYEVGSHGGRLFVAMELVDGVTLTAWLGGRRRPWREVVAMFTQIGAGLAAAHRAGLVHRDFKPDNVLIDRDGRACVADFGLARFDPDQAPSGAGAPALAVSLTRSGVMMGTPGYMAPEQQAGSAVDARADQYSYCIALREALLGGRIVKLDRRTWRHVPRALRDVVERGLALEPRERFASMDELLEALRRVERRGATAVSVAVAGLAIAGGIATTVLVMSARHRGPAPAPAAEPSRPDPLAVVSATVQALGYDGFDPAITASEVEQLSGMEQGIAKVKLGMVERRAGRCAAAVPLWTEARQVLPAGSSDASKWRARAAIGQSLCALVAGRPDEASQLATSVWVEGNQDEIRVILGLVQYEKGETRVAQAMLASSSQSGAAPIRAAVQTWLDRTGLSLP